ncbi:MAG: hypothetical protein ACFB9M_09500 [Myxococcota bacterium]
MERNAPDRIDVQMRLNLENGLRRFQFQHPVAGGQGRAKLHVDDIPPDCTDLTSSFDHRCHPRSAAGGMPRGISRLK